MSTLAENGKKYMDIMPPTNDRLLDFSRWMNRMQSQLYFVLSSSRKIEVRHEQ